MKYKAIIAYDGTDYSGWQVQPKKSTIEGILKKAFLKAFKEHITIIGASRTDAGVHALGQVAHLTTTLDIGSEKLMHAWNGRLPASILIRFLDRCDDSFHCQKNVKEKVYWYHIFLKRPLPFVARYGYYYPLKIDMEKLKDALSIFQGTHDFRSFSSGYERENTVRTITSIKIHFLERFGVYRVEIKGETFLHFMIRRIVGACMQAASNKHPLLFLEDSLAQKDPNQPLFKAPAQGLMLAKISYRSSMP